MQDYNDSMSVFVAVEDVHIISLYIFTEYGLSFTEYSSAKLDELITLHIFVS